MAADAQVFVAELLQKLEPPYEASRNVKTAAGGSRE